MVHHLLVSVSSQTDKVSTFFSHSLPSCFALYYSKIRNVALTGHSHCGKTALAEWMLFDKHVLTKPPAAQQSALDADPTEVARHASIFSHYCRLVHADHLVALTDTPWGDFPTDAVASLDGADAALWILSAADGVQPGSLSALEHCREARIPLLAVVNKMDRPFLVLDQLHADLESMAAANQGTTTAAPVLPLQVPIGQGDDFAGVVPLFVLDDQGQWQQNKNVPTEHQDAVEDAWTRLEEAVAMTDDELLVDYLEEGALTAPQIIQGLRQAVVKQSIIPLVYTSAERNLGVNELLDSMVGILPSPVDLQDEVLRVACEQEAARCNVPSVLESGFAARVLHTSVSSFGSLSVLRIIANSFNDKTDAYASLPTEAINLRTTEKVKMPSASTSVRLNGKDRLPLPDGAHIVPGDVIAVPRLPDTVRTHDILSAPEAVKEEESELAFETAAHLWTPLSRPEQEVALMTSATIRVQEAAASGGKSAKKKNSGGNNSDDKLINALRSLAREDLALTVDHDASSGDLLVHCMSSEHLQIVASRLLERYNLAVEFGSPPVQYRETLVKAVQNIEGRHKKQSGGSGQFGVCFIDMEPLPEGTGVEFESRIKGGAISKPFIASVEKGVREQLQAGGPLGGFPVTDVRIILIDGKMHSVDSKDIAFQSAGKQAVKAALGKGRTRLLQPMEEVAFTMDEKWQGEVSAIVARNDGYVTNSVVSDGTSSGMTLEAILPTSSIGEISDVLRATSAGEASFTSTFSHYQPVPDDNAKKILESLADTE